ncbi:MAG: carboxypeptidase regulatory-like domain-containing protein [Saprospiraceae bacterium]|nr:carboxypeptidase regulatory-like domain-containing protein [Saprospiraceae bacterium]
MKTLYHIIVSCALVCSGFWTPFSLHAQSCLLDHTLVIGFACTSGSEVYFQNPFLECYDAVHVVLENGTFAYWEANTNDGWQVEKIADNDLLVTHVNGFLPTAKTRALTFWHYRPDGLPDKLILLYDDQCAAEGCAAEYNLPGCGNSCISGTVYRECEEEPFTDQPTAEGFLVEVTDDMGNVVSEYTTGADGTYSICDLPPGNYEVRASSLPNGLQIFHFQGSMLYNFFQAQKNSETLAVARYVPAVTGTSSFSRSRSKMTQHMSASRYFNILSPANID